MNNIPGVYCIVDTLVLHQLTGWSPKTGCFGQRTPVHSRPDLGVVLTPCDHSLPPTRRWPDGKGQPGAGTVPLSLFQQVTGWLGQTITTCGVLVQHPHTLHNPDPIHAGHQLTPMDGL